MVERTTPDPTGEARLPCLRYVRREDDGDAGAALVVALEGSSDAGQHFALPITDDLRRALGVGAGDAASETSADSDTAGGNASDDAPKAPISPRELQSRVRAGASVDDIVRDTDMTRSRVERLAHPVLAERIHMAGKARQAHPVLASGPSRSSLEATALHGLGLRGVPSEVVSWDAWRTVEGHWVAQVTWTEGHAELVAHWRYQADKHNGVCSPLDEAAATLIDPDSAPTPSPSPITSYGRSRLSQAARAADVADGRDVIARLAQDDATGLPSDDIASARLRAPGFVSSLTVSSEELAESSTVLRFPRRPDSAQTPPPPPAKAAAEDDNKGAIAGASDSTEGPTEHDVDTDAPPAAAPGTLFGDTPAPAASSGRRRPSMPSWEDVLLGVRGSDEESPTPGAVSGTRPRSPRRPPRHPRS